MKKDLKIALEVLGRGLLISITLGLLVGCATGTYQQEAGVNVKWDEPDPANEATVRYEFDPKTGAVTAIEIETGNATLLSLLDGSELKAKSAISKSEVAKLAGNRDGMLDNNAGVNAEGLATKQELSDAIEKLGKAVKDAMNPTPVP